MVAFLQSDGTEITSKGLFNRQQERWSICQSPRTAHGVPPYIECPFIQLQAPRPQAGRSEIDVRVKLSVHLSHP